MEPENSLSCSQPVTCIYPEPDKLCTHPQTLSEYVQLQSSSPLLLSLWNLPSAITDTIFIQFLPLPCVLHVPKSDPFFFFFFFFFFYSCCSHLEHRASVKRFVSLQFLNLRQSVGLLGRGISPSQSRYLTQTEYTKTDIHALSGIQTYDPSVRASEDISCLRPRGHCDRPSVNYPK
jgi:hypothetical protein